MSFELKTPVPDHPGAWMAADPFKTEKVARIILEVDWVEGTAEIISLPHDIGTPFDVWHGMVSHFDLPVDVDATRFPDFYRERIQPILQDMARYHRVEWDGSNWVGRFRFPSPDYDPMEDDPEFEVERLIDLAPHHGLPWFFDLHDLYEGDRGLLYSDLKDNGIDLLKVDLDAPGVMERIHDMLEDPEEYVLLMDNIDLQEDLENAREVLSLEIGSE